VVVVYFLGNALIWMVCGFLGSSFSGIPGGHLFGPMRSLDSMRLIQGGYVPTANFTQPHVFQPTPASFLLYHSRLTCTGTPNARRQPVRQGHRPAAHRRASCRVGAGHPHLKPTDSIPDGGRSLGQSEERRASGLIDFLVQTFGNPQLAMYEVTH